MAPAATLTVAVAWPGLTLQVKSLEEADVTGLLLIGLRTAALLVVLPAIKVDQISKRAWVSFKSSNERT